MLTPRETPRRHRLVERPLDVVALELLVTISQALLAGILLALAHSLGADARSMGLPVPGLLAVLGLAVLVAWGLWLAGYSSVPMVALGVATATLTGALWILSLADPGLPRIDPLAGIIASSCAVLGIAAGVFLPGPRSEHWKAGPSRPRRGVPDTRATPARFSPPVQRVVDERLTPLPRPHLPRVPLPARSGTGGTSGEPSGAPISASAAGMPSDHGMSSAAGPTLDELIVALAAAEPPATADGPALRADAPVAAEAPGGQARPVGTRRSATPADETPTEGVHVVRPVDEIPTEALPMPLPLDEAPTVAMPVVRSPVETTPIVPGPAPDDQDRAAPPSA